MGQLKPIDTYWNGHLFRSRLEARWAVFFDTYGTEYDYEPEGFQLEKRWYLPDFYLPGEQIWVEIKPRLENMAVYPPIEELVTKSGTEGILLEGRPYPGQYRAALYYPNHFDTQSGGELSGCRKCPALGFYLGGATQTVFAACVCTEERWKGTCDSDRLQAAFEAASTARFEGSHAS
ncbi:hypothetical protein LCGC14_0745150 [marine sediment metagenome]|uniref:Uncharacterized protein n=1 Tax=marine sediment metagenome TaxID=412755 RepID=A0A0F9QQD1_9ZZZZ